MVVCVCVCVCVICVLFVCGVVWCGVVWCLAAQASACDSNNPAWVSGCGGFLAARA